MSYTITDSTSYKKVLAGNIDDSAYDNTSLGFNLIRIEPELTNWAWANKLPKDHPLYKTFRTPILGLLTNEFNYSLSSNWEAMTYPDNLLNIGVVTDMMAFGGAGEMGAVFKSKKVWKKSGDLTINPEIRVIDVMGDGKPLIVANQLLLYATSMGHQELISKEAVDKLSDGIGKLYTKGAKLAKDGLKYIDAINGEDAILDISGVLSLVTAIGGKAAPAMERFLEDIDDYAKLRISPPPLKVQIGKIFRHDDMVLTSIDFTFSKEVSIHGPLYVDIKLTLVTRKIISGIQDTGLYDSVANIGDGMPNQGNIVIKGEFSKKQADTKIQGEVSKKQADTKIPGGVSWEEYKKNKADTALIAQLSRDLQIAYPK